MALERRVIEGKERMACSRCGFIDYKNPLPVVVAIAVKNKRFLLIKRGLAPRKGTWGWASGFVEVGETPEEACLRELKEETGVSGKIIRLAGVARIEDKEVYGDMLAARYLVSAGDEELAPSSEVEDVRYFDRDELPRHFADRFKHIIEQVMNEIP
jgi:8-oxo-dGTP diphosphatase